jgi:hypothetical protein
MLYRRNADVDQQQLRRSWQAGDAEAGVRYLRKKLRMEQIIMPQICLAAGLLDEASLEILKDSFPEYYQYVIRQRHQKVPATRKKFVGPATGNGKYLWLSAGFSIRALIGAVDAIKEKLPEEVQQLPDECRAWLKLAAGDHEEPGQEIAERYLDFFEALPQRKMRKRRDQHEALEEPKDRACAAAFHLTHAISMSSGGWRTRWKWGWASDRMEDGVVAAFRACKFGEEGDECADRLANKIRNEALSWLLLE